MYNIPFGMRCSISHVLRSVAECGDEEELIRSVIFSLNYFGSFEYYRINHRNQMEARHLFVTDFTTRIPLYIRLTQLIKP